MDVALKFNMAAIDLPPETTSIEMETPTGLLITAIRRSYRWMDGRTDNDKVLLGGHQSTRRGRQLTEAL